MRRGKYAVEVEIDAFYPTGDPSEPCLERATVRWLDEVARRAEKGASPISSPSARNFGPFPRDQIQWIVNSGSKIESKLVNLIVTAKGVSLASPPEVSSSLTLKEAPCPPRPKHSINTWSRAGLELPTAISEGSTHPRSGGRPGDSRP